MKKIKNSRSSELLVGLLFGGIIAVLLAYRIFSWLCEVSAFVWWLVLPGLAALVLAVGGACLAYQAWRRLQYLRDHPFEAQENRQTPRPDGEKINSEAAGGEKTSETSAEVPAEAPTKEPLKKASEAPVE